MAFELPKLQYAYDALEPHVDARTMEVDFTITTFFGQLCLQMVVDYQPVTY